MPTARTDRTIRTWPLPLIAGLLPAIGAVVAVNLSIRLELIDACNPLIDGCVSVSRAARYELPNYIFRALLLPAAILQALTWLMCRDWLISLGSAQRTRITILPWLGVTAGVFLVLYGSFLGTDGQAYRWLRHYGTLVYFACTYLCMLIVAGEIRRLSVEVRSLGVWMLDRILVGLCAVTLLLGLTSVVAAPYFDDAGKDRIENVTEWWIGIAFTVGFLTLALLWQRTRFVLHAGARRD